MFYTRIFVQNFGAKNYKAGFWVGNFGTKNFVQKPECKTLMKLTQGCIFIVTYAILEIVKSKELINNAETSTSCVKM